MQTDSDILEEKTQNLDEVLTELEAVEAEEPTKLVNTTVRDVMAEQQLIIAVECLGTLKDLYSTITQEGVSVYDVQTLRSVQERMNGITSLTKPGTALEKYEGFFTKTRSSVNQTVSIEAINIEFGRILKEWFYKLLDFIIDVVKWVKNLSVNESVIRSRTERLNEQSLTAKRHLQSMRNLNVLSDRKLDGAYKLIQDAVMADPALPKNKLTIMGFGPGTYTRKFEQYIKDMLVYSKHFTAGTNTLLDILENGDQSTITNTHIGHLIEDTVKRIEEYGVCSSDEDYFSNELPNLDMSNTRDLFQRKTFYIEPLNIMLKKAINDVRRIKRFDKVTDEATLITLQAICKDLTDGVKAIERVVAVIVQLNNCYFKVSASYINYYSRCFEHTREDFTKHIVNDLTRTAYDKIVKAWDKFLDDIGFM